MSGADASSPHTGPESPATPTYEVFQQNQRDELRMLPGVAGAIPAQPGMKQQNYLLISSVEDSPAKTSVSPAAEQDSSAASAAASSSSAPVSQMSFYDQADGSSLRTYPDFFPATVDAISLSFSRRWPTSGSMTSLGECWTHDISESPSGGGVSSSLRDVLEESVPERYFLSPKAAAGILRRAEKRGRDLPPHLLAALRVVAESTRPDDAKRTT